MKTSIALFLCFAFVYVLPAQQWDIIPGTSDITNLNTGNVLIGNSTTPPAAGLTLEDRSFLITGTTGPHPITTPGTYFGWLPEKESFVAGRMTSNQWTEDSLGTGNFVFGQNNRCSGNASIVVGQNHNNIAFSSAIFGNSNKIFSSGYYSIAAGAGNIITGPYSGNFGVLNSSEGVASFCLGAGNSAVGSGSFAVGIQSHANGDGTRAEGTFVSANAPAAMTMGQGVDIANPLVNTHPSSLIIGFYSDSATVYVTQSEGVGTTGAVGIGTTEIPDDSKLAVKGKITCEELSVKAFPTWADYVFTDGYELRTLPELEAYVKLNHHLPGIPSAEEVTTQGVNVGEIQVALLEKVEELTLYVIELQKEINELKEDK